MTPSHSLVVALVLVALGIAVFVATSERSGGDGECTVGRVSDVQGAEAVYEDSPCVEFP